LSKARILLGLIGCLAISGCRSAFIDAAIVNRSGKPAQLIEVDYPYASFGTQEIATDQTYHYQFKVQGSGPVKITFTGEHNNVHTSTGPVLKEGQHGELTVILGTDGKVNWTTVLSTAR
jgi:hypothetical protein